MNILKHKQIIFGTSGAIILGMMVSLSFASFSKISNSSLPLDVQPREEANLVAMSPSEINHPKPKDPWPVVAVSFRKVMSELAALHEQIRESEAPTAILLCTADDRIEMMATELKEKLNSYQNTRQLRIDFLTDTTELPDYTDDFLNHMNGEPVSDE